MSARTFCFMAASFLLLFALHSYAQFSNYKEPWQDTRGSKGYNFEIGGNTFLGDLGGTSGIGKPSVKDFNGETLRPYFGVSYTRFPFSWISVKGGLHFTMVTDADSLIKERVGHSAGRFERNLSFKSAIEELSAEIEFYPFQTIYKYEEAQLRPFIGSGIGLFHFNPKAQLNGKWYNLRPLHLEGQSFPEYPERKNYKLTQPYIPLTLGLKYRLSNSYFISLSTCIRKTFTDYIDDVATTYIDPTLFDKYLSPTNATLAKQLYYRASPFSDYVPTEYRGYHSKDSYASIFFTITYIFDNRNGFNFIGN